MDKQPSLWRRIQHWWAVAHGVPEIPLPRISIDQITDYVHLGARIATLDEYQRVRAMGIRASIDLKLEGADPWAFDAFLWLPAADQEPPSLTHLHLGIAFLEQCERSRLPVLVHCHAGIGRSATLVLAYLLVCGFGELGDQAALAFLRQRRRIVNPTPAQIAAAIAAAREYRVSRPPR
ncbi:MAG: dual specificity protein phosphatase family protein [Vicinamibacteria bacterium]|jgi:predicted protein tyrosine phosphatase|nr:dual specificity protein phosphatase family protein [Vicinamibacteria bacterium]